jgi:hypothetical protein
MAIQQMLLGGRLSIDSLFSTDLYTGNATSTPNTQTITNGIDLSSEGGLVWIKSRSHVGNNHFFDTSRGAGKWIVGNDVSSENSDYSTLTSFNSNGFSLGADNSNVNRDTVDYAAWTFRKQPKFFDIVEYTGTMQAQTLSHNLGSEPGAMIIVQKTGGQTAYRWFYHRDMGSGTYLFWHDGTGSNYNTWMQRPPTSTDFTIPADQYTNYGNSNYVVYLWAHDAVSEFSPDGNTPLIKCGSYNGSNSTAIKSENLGFEPQFIIIKKEQSGSQFVVSDSTRGTDNYVFASSTAAEQQLTGEIVFTSTGFDINPTSNGGISSLNQSGNYLYIAVAAP